MIQDIEPKVFHNQYKEHHIKQGDCIVHFYGKMIYVNRNEDEITFPKYEELQQCNPRADMATERFTYLFSIDNRRYYLYDMAEELAIPGFSYTKMFDIRRCHPKHRVMAAATAWHLHVWYDSNRYCGRCGMPTEKDGNERMLRCPHCGNMIFPKVVPAVIVGVIDDDKLLLTRYAGREYKRYALIAGFNEIGETIEETVRREVMEEVGLHVKNIRYYKSQPWGFDSDLLLGFFCEVDDDAPIHMDEKELEYAEWVRREEIPVYEEHLSLTHEMMQLFKTGKVDL